MDRIRDYALAKFGTTKVLDFALGVEVVTTAKRANLILNVDGCIAVCFIAYYKDLCEKCFPGERATARKEAQVTVKRLGRAA